jgi:mannose-1-phosphate guanylyltransferase
MKRGTTSLPKQEASLKAVILVGGPGTRLQPLTDDTPKSMVPVLNKPFMEHTISYLKQFGIEDIIITLNYLPEVIHNYFGDGSRFGVRLAYCLEKKPMGTAGAVKNAEAHLNNTFIVLNGDIFADMNIADMLAYHRNKGDKVTISLNWVDNPSAFGVVETDGDQRVSQFVEKPPIDEVTTNWINAGTYILEPEVLEHVPANSHYMFEKGLFPLLLEMGKPVYGYPLSGYWLDMGTVENYLSLNSDLLLSKTTSPLIYGAGSERVYCEQDVTIHPSAKIIAPAMIGNRCQISRGVYIKGPVVMGSDCHLEEGASIENTVLWDNIRIGAHARISQCIIASHTSIESNKQVVNRVVTPSQETALSQKSEANAAF